MFKEKYITVTCLPDINKMPEMVRVVEQLLLEWLELHLPKEFFRSQNRWWKLIDGVEWTPFEYNGMLINSFQYKMRLMDNTETVNVTFIPHRFILEEDSVNVLESFNNGEAYYSKAKGCLLYTHFTRSTDKGNDKSKWENSLINYLASRLEEYYRTYWCVKYPTSWCIFTRQQNHWRRIDKRTRLRNMRWVPRKTIQPWMRTDWHSLRKGKKKSTLLRRWKARAAVAVDILNGFQPEMYQQALIRARNHVCDNNCTNLGIEYLECRGQVLPVRLFDIDWDNGTGQDLGWVTRCESARNWDAVQGFFSIDHPNLEIAMFRKAVTDNKALSKEEKLSYYRTWLRGWSQRRKEYYSEFQFKKFIVLPKVKAMWEANKYRKDEEKALQAEQECVDCEHQHETTEEQNNE